ncbi:MAG TPA: hypothetical protein VK809_03020 [Bacteroidia bacterium]|jgi:hypothetical protein|nr:hypothetical protein [Bacteroidia bacterium]
MRKEEIIYRILDKVQESSVLDPSVMSIFNELHELDLSPRKFKEILKHMERKGYMDILSPSWQDGGAIHFNFERPHERAVFMDEYEKYIREMPDKDFIKGADSQSQVVANNPVTGQMELYIIITKTGGVPRRYSKQEYYKLSGLSPTFNAEEVKQIFNILKVYFIPEQQPELYSILMNGGNVKEKLLFTENGNKLIGAFRRLFDAPLITGCQKRI